MTGSTHEREGEYDGTGTGHAPYGDAAYHGRGQAGDEVAAALEADLAEEYGSDDAAAEHLSARMQRAEGRGDGVPRLSGEDAGTNTVERRHVRRVQPRRRRRRPARAQRRGGRHALRGDDEPHPGVRRRPLRSTTRIAQATTVTRSACGPRGPSPISNSTRWSCIERPVTRPSRSREKCTNTSGPAVDLDEAVALLLVEPLHGALPRRAPRLTGDDAQRKPRAHAGHATWAFVVGRPSTCGSATVAARTEQSPPPHRAEPSLHRTGDRAYVDGSSRLHPSAVVSHKLDTPQWAAGPRPPRWGRAPRPGSTHRGEGVRSAAGDRRDDRDLAPSGVAVARPSANRTSSSPM